MTDLWTLIDWFFYGFVRYVLFWIPLLTPFAVDRGMPHQWTRYNSYWDWLHLDDNNGGPDEHWLQCWFRMTFGEALRTATGTASDIVDRLESRVRGWLGSWPGRFASLSHWLDFLDNLIGGYIPSWAGTIAYGLDWLRDRLPAGIRQGWKTWQGYFDDIASSVRSWVRGYVDAFRDLASRAWDWIVGVGAALDSWRHSVAGWIDHFKSNPYGYIVGLLGEAWQWLRTFRDRGRDQVLAWLGPEIHGLLAFGRSCVQFYYALWSIGWETLGSFVNDPREFLIEKLESALADRW